MPVGPVFSSNKSGFGKSAGEVYIKIFYILFYWLVDYLFYYILIIMTHLLFSADCIIIRITGTAVAATKFKAAICLTLKSWQLIIYLKRYLVALQKYLLPLFFIKSGI